MSISPSFRLLSPKIPFLLQPKSPIFKIIFHSPQFPPKPSSNFSISIQRFPTKTHSSSPPSSSVPSSSLQPIEDLPKNLQEIITLFQSVQDSKAKYEQLLFYGRKLTPLDEQFKTNENKVEGCVSRVWVRAYLDDDSNKKNVFFEADSDSSLTRGLAALLVQGLSGQPVSEILKVSPDFVTLLGIQQSLTPSRNNGFLNMLKLMQRKALQLSMEVENGGKPLKVESLDVQNQIEGETQSGYSNFNDESLKLEKMEDVESGLNLLGSRGERIKEILEKKLNPIDLEIEDISYQHAGHAGVRGNANGETHFNVKVVSDEFDGKSLVKRHRLVYELLQEELQNGLHALSIVAKTPAEVNDK